jgi:hypothetical protein
VEKVANLGSMAWKNAEFNFHGVEVRGAGERENERKGKEIP